jgi:hypothetical protein
LHHGRLVRLGRYRFGIAVSALVYVAARAPDADEDYTALAKTIGRTPASVTIMPEKEWPTRTVGPVLPCQHALG